MPRDGHGVVDEVEIPCLVHVTAHDNEPTVGAVGLVFTKDLHVG